MAQVKTEFWRVIKAADGKPGKVHVCINRVPIDEMWEGEEFQSHASGIERVGWTEFLARPCGVNEDDGHVGPNGCVSRLQEGLVA